MCGKCNRFAGTQIILRIAEKVLMGCVPERFSLLSVYTDDSFCTL